MILNSMVMNKGVSVPNGSIVVCYCACFHMNRENRDFAEEKVSFAAVNYSLLAVKLKELI